MARNQAAIQTAFNLKLLARSTNSHLEMGVLEAFPYPIHIYSADGTSVYVNPAFLREFNFHDDREIIGRYNILADQMIDIAGIREDVERAFRGTTVSIKDSRVPTEYITSLHHITAKDSRSMYQDITAFPLLDPEGRVLYVVVMMITRREYNGKTEISRAQEYIQNHSGEKYNLQRIAKAAGFSPAYFARLFRKHTGTTPHEYYIKDKVGRIKEKLKDQKLSIAEAFAACGVEYNGHFARVFRQNTGMTPSQYRQRVLR